MLDSEQAPDQFAADQWPDLETMTRRLRLNNLVTAWLLADSLTASELQQLWIETVKELDGTGALPSR